MGFLRNLLQTRGSGACYFFSSSHCRRFWFMAITWAQTTQRFMRPESKKQPIPRFSHWALSFSCTMRISLSFRI